MSQFQIKPFDKTHVDQVSILHEDTFAKGWSKDFFNESFDNNKLSFVAIADDMVIGFIMIQTVIPESEIITLLVHANFRCQGVGQQLLSKVMTTLAETGYSQIFLEVRQDNLAAIELYEKFGFKTIGTRQNYYKTKEGQLFDAIIFNKILKNNLNSVSC